MDKPIQYLLVGFPYSGKTTLARELEKRLGLVHINLDRLKWDMGYSEVGDDDVPDEVWEKIFRKADELLVENLKKGKSVVNEYAWITREWRDRARKAAADTGCSTRLIYIEVPQEEIKKRWLENSRAKERFHWPEVELERMFKDFEEPTTDEDVINFDQTIPLERWIEENFRH